MTHSEYREIAIKAFPHCHFDLAPYAMPELLKSVAIEIFLTNRDCGMLEEVTRRWLIKLNQTGEL